MTSAFQAYQDKLKFTSEEKSRFKKLKKKSRKEAAQAEALQSGPSPPETNNIFLQKTKKIKLQKLEDVSANEVTVNGGSKKKKCKKVEHEPSNKTFEPKKSILQKFKNKNSDLIQFSPMASNDVTSVDGKRKKYDVINKIDTAASQESISVETRNEKTTKSVAPTQLNESHSESPIKKRKKRKLVDIIEDEPSVTPKKTKENHPMINGISPFHTIGKSKTETCNLSDSRKNGRAALAWMICPISLKEFFANVWEKQPLFIQRNKKDFFSSIMTSKDVDSLLRENEVYFTKNIDVTYYEDGKRRTDNPCGRATAAAVWDFYKNGRSIRLLNPQCFVHRVGLLTSTLQEYFGCFVGVNAYLTPPDSQGFAPHWDDIEAFVLQLEGTKIWKVYKPRCDKEKLPIYSSDNLKEEDIGTPVLEVTLQPGDLLYFPRGFIHQARCVPGKHSLHITVSAYQKHTWGELLEKVVSGALLKATEDDIDFRSGLPLNYLNHLGVVHSDQDSFIRKSMTEKIKELMYKLTDYAPIDAAADQMAKIFMHDALPPHLSEDEIEFTYAGLTKKKAIKFYDSLTSTINTNLGIKLVRANVLRLVSEEDSLLVYYYSDNPKEYHSMEPFSFEISDEEAPVVELLINSYPEYVRLLDLPLPREGMTEQQAWTAAVEFVCGLLDKRLVLLNQPIAELVP